jgi:AcrR family transcriptional regulator
MPEKKVAKIFWKLNSVHYFCIETIIIMSIATRKQREKNEMRSLILDAARKIFLEKGYHLTSMRNIAEEIEYSVGTIYLYFKEKDEIFHALHEEGFRRMLAMMQPLQHVAEPFERLKALGKVYMQFAKENKDFYDLMFIMNAPMDQEKDPDKWEMGDNTLNFLRKVLKECQLAGRFNGLDIEDLSFTIWSAMHGMCALYCRDRCLAYPDRDPLLLMDNGYKNFIAMLEKV